MSHLSIRKSVLYSSISQYLLKIIGFVSVIIMARLLTPAELGIYAISSSIVLIVSELKLLGTANYLVREKSVSVDKVRSGVGLSMIFSWGLGLSLFLLSGNIADFYDISELMILFQVLALNFFFAPFTSVTTSMLSRGLQFNRILIVNVTTEIIRFTASILFVLSGMSYMGLAWGILVGSVVEFCMLFWLRPVGVSWMPSFSGLSPIFRFGLYSSMTNLLARFDSNLPDLIIGKLGVPSQVAFFSRGVGFLSFITQLISSGIWPVILPYFSKVSREGGDVSAAYSRSVELTGGIVWPVLAVAGAISYPVIIFLFGEQWVESVELVSVLAIWAIFRAIHNLSPQLLITMGKERLMLVKQITVFLFSIVLIYLAFPYGLIWVAWAMALVGVIDFLIGSLVVFIAIGLTPLRFVLSMWKNIVLVLSCLSVALLLDAGVNFTTTKPLFSLLLVASVESLVWFLGIWILKHPLYFEIYQVITSLKQKRLKHE